MEGTPNTLVSIELWNEHPVMHTEHIDYERNTFVLHNQKTVRSAFIVEGTPLSPPRFSLKWRCLKKSDSRYPWFDPLTPPLCYRPPESAAARGTQGHAFHLSFCYIIGGANNKAEVENPGYPLTGMFSVLNTNHREIGFWTKYELSSDFPNNFRRKMGADNMKNGGSLISSFQNTQKHPRSTKTHKVRAVEPLVKT